MSEYILVGVIVKTKGFKGEMLLVDVPQAIENVIDNIDVLVGYTEQFSKKYHLTQFKRYQKNAVIKFREITSDSDANKLREYGLFALKKEINRRKNTYIDHELAKCKVYDFESGDFLGEIVDVLELPANDVWMMRMDDDLEVPLPVIDEVIKSVDIDKKEIKITMMDGLMELGS